MEQTLGLLSDTGGGGNTVNLSNENSSTSPKMEKDHMVVSDEAELELGLGLSLSSCRSNAKSIYGKAGSAAPRRCGGVGGEYGRILTAKDFPNGFSNSVNSVVSGTKRAAPDLVPSAATANAVSQVVGWPPVGAHRMNTLVNQAKSPSPDEGKGGAGSSEKEESSKKKINHGGSSNKDEEASQERSGGHIGFVKVYIDGLLFGRKVDLNAHPGYESLAETLEEMFFKSATSKDPAKQPSKLLDGSSEFALTYEDREGDWMLVGDVPWGMFLSSVKRLRIMKTSEATGLDKNALGYSSPLQLRGPKRGTEDKRARQ